MIVYLESDETREYPLNAAALDARWNGWEVPIVSADTLTRWAETFAAAIGERWTVEVRGDVLTLERSGDDSGYPDEWRAIASGPHAGLFALDGWVWIA